MVRTSDSFCVDTHTYLLLSLSIPCIAFECTLPTQAFDLTISVDASACVNRTAQLPADLRAKRSKDLEEIASCELQNRVLSVEENGHAAVDGAVAQDAEERDIKKPVLALWPTLTRRAQRTGGGKHRERRISVPLSCSWKATPQLFPHRLSQFQSV